MSTEPGVPEQFERNHAAIHQADPGECGACDRVRNGDIPKLGHVTVSEVPFHFQNGHDYLIEWQIPGVHKKPRTSRVGFVAANGSRISVDARGPNRSMAKPYGGTAEIDRRWMINIIEVSRDLSKRYTIRT
jgi:hypothetical protein